MNKNENNDNDSSIASIIHRMFTFDNNLKDNSAGSSSSSSSSFSNNNNNNNINNSNHFNRNYTNVYFCELIFRSLLPNLYTNLELNGFTGMYEFLSKINVSSPSSSQMMINGHMNRHTSSGKEYSNHVHHHDAAFCSYTLDLANYFNVCYQVESNLVYLDWLLSLFKPLLYALSLLFILPSMIVILLYASSLFLFLNKHWKKLKVSVCASALLWHLLTLFY
jgi:hypothetical protein